MYIYIWNRALLGRSLWMVSVEGFVIKRHFWGRKKVDVQVPRRTQMNACVDYRDGRGSFLVLCLSIDRSEGLRSTPEWVSVRGHIVAHIEHVVEICGRLFSKRLHAHLGQELARAVASLTRNRAVDEGWGRASRDYKVTYWIPPPWWSLRIELLYLPRPIRPEEGQGRLKTVASPLRSSKQRGGTQTFSCRWRQLQGRMIPGDFTLKRLV